MKMKYPDHTVYRHSIRLKDYDYTQPGAYFITICTHNKQCLFSEIVTGENILNEYGEIVQTTWSNLTSHYLNIDPDKFVTMPNHVHGILFLKDNNGRAGLKPAPTKDYPLSEIIRAFKTFSSRRINEVRHTPEIQVWQRNYYEHIIRNEEDLNECREYIMNNPAKWELDKENPRNIKVRAGLKPAPTNRN